VTKTQRGDIVYYFEGRPDIQAERRDGLQIMKFKPIVNRAMACVKQVPWHERLGHINPEFLRKAAEKEAAYGLENMLKEDFKCEICIKAKSGECVHSDLLHSTVTSHKGNKYFLVVKDEGSSFRQVYFQKEKSKEKRVHGNKLVVNYVHF
jgi:hypothetical protein